jgi:formamidopyrimidine-DNA glycosylase
MIEIPEAIALSRQLTETIIDKKVAKVIAASSPHKFAWFHGDPSSYASVLREKTVRKAQARGGFVEIWLDDTVLLFTDGVLLKYHKQDEKRPLKHQLLVEFNDGTAISAAVQMYGGLWCFKEDEFDNPYYDSAISKPSPLSEEFDWAYFDQLLFSVETLKLSAKAFLATEQRIPGLGNGVLQDILFNAGIHPKRYIKTLTEKEKDKLFHSIKSTLKDMTELRGRDTTKDLFGEPGGYKTKLSQNTVGKSCSICGHTIVKQSYMGGSIYICEGCQKI